MEVGGAVKFGRPPSKLSSWKEIAAHLHVSEDTAQRWAKRYGLPVAQAQPRGAVLADPAELDAWIRAHARVTRQTKTASSGIDPTAPSTPPLASAPSSEIDIQRKLLVVPYPWYVLLSAGLFAAHAVISFLLEASYEWTRLGTNASRASWFVFIGNFWVSVLIFRALANFAGKGANQGFALLLVRWIAAVLAIAGACLPLLPGRSVITSWLPLGTARLGSAQAGYIKDITFALTVVILFQLPTYYRVLLLRREARLKRRPSSTRLILDESFPAVVPLLLPRPWLVLGLVVIFILSVAGGGVLVLGAPSGAYYTRFVNLLVARYALQLALAIAGFVWYDFALGGVGYNRLARSQARA